MDLKPNHNSPETITRMMDKSNISPTPIDKRPSELPILLELNPDTETANAGVDIGIKLHQSNKKCRAIGHRTQTENPASSKTLQPPAPIKQYLISPPGSPSAGWEPHEEKEPLVNYDLLAALTNLTPGERYEIHPQSEEKPAIVVQTAELEENLTSCRK